MNQYPIEGQRVITHDTLKPTLGMLIVDKHLVNRKPATTGIVRQAVPGHGGDVWFVEHGAGDIAAYSIGELSQDLTTDGKVDRETALARLDVVYSALNDISLGRVTDPRQHAIDVIEAVMKIGQKRKGERERFTPLCKETETDG